MHGHVLDHGPLCMGSQENLTCLWAKRAFLNVVYGWCLLSSSSLQSENNQLLFVCVSVARE